MVLDRGAELEWSGRGEGAEDMPGAATAPGAGRSSSGRRTRTGTAPPARTPTSTPGRPLLCCRPLLCVCDIISICSCTFHERCSCVGAALSSAWLAGTDATSTYCDVVNAMRKGVRRPFFCCPGPIGLV